MKKIIALIACLAMFSCSASKDVADNYAGFNQLVKGDIATAEMYFKDAIDENEKNIYAINNLGVVYQRTGRIEEAKKQYEIAAAANSSEIPAHVTDANFKGKTLGEIAKYNAENIK